MLGVSVVTEYPRLLIRNARLHTRGTHPWEGQRLFDPQCLSDVRINDGIIEAIGHLKPEPNEVVLEASGGSLIPGLHDHHIHVLAAAARRASVSLAHAGGDRAAVLHILERAVQRTRPGEWIRAVDYFEDGNLRLDRLVLDSVTPVNPVRVQHQTGGLWILNSRALDQVMKGLVDREGGHVSAEGSSADKPSGLERLHLTPGVVERDTCGRPNGRLHRMDEQLKECWPAAEIDLASLGEELLGMGITGLVDATPSYSTAAARLLIEAHSSGDLPQNLVLMGADEKTLGSTLVQGGARSGAYSAVAQGPVKIVLGDHQLPDFDELCTYITEAHAQGRPVAIHTVTYDSAFIACHALALAGTLQGDRLEHLALAGPEIVEMVRDLGLTVVTQPGFLAAKGDRYLSTISPDEHEDLYRYRSLRDLGVPVLPSSDHPYGPVSPWTVIHAAATRQTGSGKVLGSKEAVSAASALSGYQTPLPTEDGVVQNAGVPSHMAKPRSTRAGAPQPDDGHSIAVGASADLCLLNGPLEDVLARLCENDENPVVGALVGRWGWFA